MDFQKTIADTLNKHLNKDVSNLIEVPPKPELGDFAFPCFTVAKELRKAPPMIAQDLASELKIEGIRVTATGPYVNFFIDNLSYTKSIISEVLEKKEKYGSERLKDETIVIDYSGPNVAKNMGIHNLRSTIIGQALCNIYRFLGYKVVGVNHLGDWGTQFGKLIWALEKWSSPEELEEKGIVFLNEMYVKFHDEVEKDENGFMEDEARVWFKKIEEGDEKAQMWWKLFVDISMKDYNKIFDRLSIEFDYTIGESFYIQHLENTIKTLEDAKLTSMSEGALVVEFDEKDNMPPCLLKKSDGATLYGTRDLAAAMYRLKEYNPTKVLYAVDIAQALHFKQVFKVLEKLDSKNKDIFEHIQFGRLSFADAKMSTRKGNIVPLREVLDKAHEKVLEVIKEKNPDLANKEEVAEMVGTGAVIFGDLSCDRVHNIIFDWKKILDFQGETAPYVQYTVARINSILRKGNYEEQESEIVSNLNYELISTDAEKNVARLLTDFNKVVNEAKKSNKPHHIGKYVVQLAQALNSYYVNNQIIQPDNKDLQNARLALIFTVKQVLENGLLLLGIKCPTEM